MAKPTSSICTHLAGLGDLRGPHAVPRAGTRLLLRQARTGRGFEAVTADGARVGRLPAEVHDAVAALLATGAPVGMRVAAVLPRIGLAGAARLHVEILAEEDAAAAA